MKGFVYSFTLAAGVLLLMQIPLFKYGVGFFAAIPLSVLAIPLRSLPHAVGYAILIFGAPSIAIIALGYPSGPKLNKGQQVYVVRRSLDSFRYNSDTFPVRNEYRRLSSRMSGICTKLLR